MKKDKTDDRPVAYPKKSENDEMLQHQDEYNNARQSNRGKEAPVSDDLGKGSENITEGAE